ncbi:ATP-binding cassette domain-containing protein [Clostridium sp. AF19-22AC]|jgi:peptide/nickel transport system ATP-binding protein|uniref:Oligopeptide/dipeptide ABC transporter ATP-binding protein n=1 Tax=Faecalicatena orotica TaxID=1544 RepID=A0A2Y9BF59_9FIRM|nr:MULTISPECIES: oligopeptide/dipeptide ABC transporter ATP-binding protein [Clostridia]PWJ28969.1 oligopeptide/dipeptide ABC transporter ATP-binding protein [Faecalicatena orotica]RHR33131.1 ATP-binding cassette domain-containing protein [Clostridium sp. AF19-22AC]SSA56138.1 oligopeptide/dipeptide ABC transporter, ATP-binding protein, C-terminal domain-containing protein [Faecalicatena orotica]
MSEKKILLECKNLMKYFETPRGMLHAVDDVTFRLEEGKTLGVVGESGCGKSTLGRTILRLLPSTGGQIIFDGKDITKLPDKEMLNLRKQMQIVFQDPFSSLDPKMTVSQIIEEPLKIHKLYNSKEKMSERVSELMEIVGLDDRYVNTYPHELDGGRRQRIGIARAIALNPKFIVCDEPVSALDVSIQAQILNLMMDLKEELGLTYIFITHDLSVVKHISDEILVLYLGKMVEKTSSDRLFENPLHPYTKALLSAIPIPDIAFKGKEAQVMKGEVTSPIEPPEGCRFASRCPNATERCFKVSPEFKEVEEDHFVACHLYE